MVASPARCTKRFVLGQLIPAAPYKKHPAALLNGHRVPMWDMSRIRPQCLDADASDHAALAHVLLREEPDEEEEGEEDQDGGEEDDDGDEGYSE